MQEGISHLHATPGLCHDLLKIKQLQTSLKLHLTNMLEDLPPQKGGQFPQKEILNSRASIQRQPRFPKVPKKVHRSRMMLTAPTPQQVMLIKHSLIGSHESEREFNQSSLADGDCP